MIFIQRKKEHLFFMFIAIPSDKNNVLLKETMKRAERKLTRVEFIKRHPNAF